MMQLLVKAVLSYLLGSIVGSLLIRRWVGGPDIRSLGSGNAGATNALRTLGKKVAFAVLVIDVAKGWIATGLIAPRALPGFSADTAAIQAWVAPACGIAVMLGHVYPIWYGLRGGKGMATLVGVVIGLSMRLLVPMLLAFLITVMLFGFVGLGSMVSVLALVVTMALEHRGAPLMLFAILALALMCYTHRSNIARMREGTENRARRLWLFGLRREPS
jgi:glycerol-3-phosphate acyltransferase PlsY